MTERRETFLIKGKPLRYRVRHNRRARFYRITVSKREGVRVLLPKGGSFKDLPELLQERSLWLEEMANLHDCWDGPVVKQYATGSMVMVQGRFRTLKIEALPAGRSRPKITLEEDRIHMVLPPKDILDPRPVLAKWLRKLARHHLDQRVTHWSEIIGLFPERMLIADTKAQWGSCNGRGTVSFCYRLIMAPPQVMDEVVVHELCHLEHLNHSKQFYALLRRFYPVYREYHEWLPKNFADLQL